MRMKHLKFMALVAYDIRDQTLQDHPVLLKTLRMTQSMNGVVKYYSFRLKVAFAKNAAQKWLWVKSSRPFDLLHWVAAMNFICIYLLAKA